MKFSSFLLLSLIGGAAATKTTVRGSSNKRRTLEKDGKKVSSKKGGSKKGGTGKKSTGKKGMTFSTTKPPPGENVCAGKGDPRYENINCFTGDGLVDVGGQAGVNVTKGYNGNLDADHDPITVPYYQMGLCPVNVHWHLGTEHYSLDQYDETGTGPTPVDYRRKLAGKARKGYQCKLYDDSEEIYTAPYHWKYCTGMEVGQTYEVHWPHSALGACGTLNQYQTPFYDGVLCHADRLDGDLQDHVGVQSQVFTIVNDEDYFYPDLMSGMIVDGDMGQDVAMFTGSTTGTTRTNEVCSQYTPITWQVDRVCHKISASTFDKMCADMLSHRDDMSDDIYPHGSRELVIDDLANDNHSN